MTELNEIIKKYSTLLGVMEQLEKEAPMIEKTYKELQSIINNQLVIEKDALEKIENQAKSSVEEAEKIEIATKELMKQCEKFEALVEKSKKQQDDFLKNADEKIAELKKLSSNNISAVDVAEIYSRLSRAEIKISAFEHQGQIVPAKDNPKLSITEKTNTSTYSTAKNRFPSDAKHFTFDNIKRVTRKKPYGIAIEGNIIKVNYWTNMLDSTIPYVINKYHGDVDELCEANYGTSRPQFDGTEVFFPYFVKGIKNGDYRHINGTDLSVLYSGAEETVRVLHQLLCVHFGINEKDVELFYHDN